MDRYAPCCLHCGVHRTGASCSLLRSLPYPNNIRYLLDTCVANKNIKCYKKKKPYHLAVYLHYGDCESVLIDKKIEMAIAAGDQFLGI